MAYQEQTPSTAVTEIATVSLAIELSTTKWVIMLTNSVERRFSNYQVDANDCAALVRLIERDCARLVARGCAVRVFSCYEAGRDGFWLHRFLEQHGVRNHVIDPASIRVERRGRRAKTDGIDVRQQLMTLHAHLRGEPRACSMVRVPTETEEDAKRPDREREALIDERTRHVNRIKSLCALHGVKDYEPIAGDRWPQLDALKRYDGTPLPANLTQQIKRELLRLELVVKQVRELERQRNAVLKESDAAPKPGAHKIRKLFRMRGVGVQTATRLTHEVFYRHFDNRRQVAGYVGLAPAPFKSGTIDRDQGIAKSGNPWARTAMIEFAWLWLYHQPHSELSRWFWKRVGAMRGRIRRITIVALARKLLIALWHYVERDLIPAGATLKKA